MHDTFYLSSSNRSEFLQFEGEESLVKKYFSLGCIQILSNLIEVYIGILKENVQNMDVNKKKWYTLQDSNLWPSVPQTDALSS